MREAFLRFLGTTVLAGFCLVAGRGLASNDAEVFPPPIPLEEAGRAAECDPVAENQLQQLAAIFEFMKTGPAHAVACVAWLEDNAPGWHHAEGAAGLVVPFVTFLLSDGSVQGMMRHQIFVDLLGHLEKIEPGWRYDPRARELMPRIVLASTVEDPFVAHFWSTTLREMDPDWRDSEAAKSALPTLYRLALEEETEAGGPSNERPKALLKEVSWWGHARLQLATRVFDSWPKRILGLSIAILIFVFATVAVRRRSRA